MTNLSSVLDQAASDHPERPAVRLDDLVLSYGELRNAAGRMAALLPSLGVAPGDRVAIMLPNVPAFPIAFYGALAAGAVVVPMNPLLKSREVAFHLNDSGAKVLFVWSAVAEEAIRAPIRPAPGSSRSASPTSPRCWPASTRCPAAPSGPTRTMR